MSTIKHKYQWYLNDSQEFIYDEDVVRYLSPRIKRANQTLSSIKETIDNINLDGNIINDYLEIGEALSIIELLLDMRKE